MSRRSELIDHYDRVREQLDAALAGLSDEQMSERSLDGWSVVDHVAHVALWDDARADDVERVSAGHAPGFRMSDKQDELFNQVGHEVRRDWTPAQARWELDRSHRRLLAAIAAAPESALDPALYGDAGLRSTHDAEHAGWIRTWRDARGY